jgi:hypothetical protein
MPLRSLRISPLKEQEVRAIGFSLLALYPLGLMTYGAIRANRNPHWAPNDVAILSVSTIFLLAVGTLFLQ